MIKEHPPICLKHKNSCDTWNSLNLKYNEMVYIANYTINNKFPYFCNCMCFRIRTHHYIVQPMMATMM